MSAISLRLSDELDARLKAEAQYEGKPQSEIARLAIVEYLEHREKERFMTEIINAARALATDPAASTESQELEEDLVAEGLDAIIETEKSTARDATEKWWK